MRTLAGIRSLARVAGAASFAAFTGLAASACYSVTAVQDDGSFLLQVGDRARSNDFTVRFVSVPQESRCAVDVTCVWAGDAVVRLDISVSGHGTRTVDLHTNSTVGDVSTERDGYVVELIDLTPAPHSGRTTDQSEYTASLRLSRI